MKSRKKKKLKTKFLEDNQICKKCLQNLDIENFEWQKDRPSPKTTCKSCVSKIWPRSTRFSVKNNIPRKSPRVRNDKASKNKAYLRRYGISFDDKVKMIELQDNKCAICLNIFKDLTDSHIDHCHTSGLVRGILCKNCNLGIGFLKENIDYLKSAELYIQKYQLIKEINSYNLN